MKRRFIYSLIIFAMLVIIVYFYINKVFLPHQFKDILEEKAKTFLKREVTIGRIGYQPIKGFIFQQVIIFQKDDPQKPFAHFNEIHFNFILASLVKDKKIIIPSISIQEPFVQVIRKNDNSWNFSDLLEHKNKADQANMPDIFLKKITLKNGSFNYRDLTQKQPFTEIIKNIDLNMEISIDRTVLFSFKSFGPKHKSLIQADAVYAIDTKRITSDLTLENISLARYQPLFPREESFHIDDGMLRQALLSMTFHEKNLKISGSAIFNNLDVDIEDDKNLQGHITLGDMSLIWEDERLSGSSHVQMTGAIDLGDKRILKGNLQTELKELLIADQSLALKGTLNLQDGNFSLADDQNYAGNLSVQQMQFESANNKLTLQGDFYVKNSHFTFNPTQMLKGSIEAKNFSLSSSDNQLTIKSELKLNNGQAQIDDQRSLSGLLSTDMATLTLSNSDLELNSKFSIEKALLKVNENLSFHGQPTIDLSYSFSPKDKITNNYSGTVVLSDGSFEGVPKVDLITGVKGTVQFRPDHIESDQLVLNTQNTDILLQGHVDNFSKPHLDIQASSENVDLSIIAAFFPDQLEKLPISLSGQSSLKTTFQGKLSDLEEAEITLDAYVDHATLSSEKLPEPIKNIKGSIAYEKDLISWKDLHGEFENTSYELTGHLEDLSRPTVKTTLASEFLNLTTEINILRQAFQIESLEGKYHHSGFNIKGDVHIFDDSAPDWDLRGEVVLDLIDLPILSQEIYKKLEHLNPMGSVYIDGLFKGKFKPRRDWQLTFRSQSPDLSLMGHPLGGIQLHYGQRDLYVSRFDVISPLYNGKVNITSSFDLGEIDIPCKMNIQVESLDLANYRKSQDIKYKQLAGYLDLTATLEGPVKNIEKITGDGTISVSEGYLWEWSLLKGLSGALLIPELQSVIFTEGKSNFTIKDKRVYFENAELLSNQMNLRGSGWIDFDQNIKFDVLPDVSQIAILQSESMKKGPTQLLTQDLKVNVSGTLKNPQYDVENVPLKIIESTTDILREGIGTILEGIFD